MRRPGERGTVAQGNQVRVGDWRKEDAYETFAT